MAMISNLYKNAFEKHCFKLLVDAYQVVRVNKKYQTDWQENDFSQILEYYINENLYSLSVGITCKTEQKLLSCTENLTKGFSDKLPRVDLVFFKVSKDKRFQYFMEAKILKEKDSKLKRAYISEGMQRYISKKYPIEERCMLGYLIEGNLDLTIVGINKLIIKGNKKEEILKPVLNSFANFYYESEHTEIGVLKHIILDFTKNNRIDES
ncbi:hypothetical protein ACILD7_05000 [Capnocytophaga canimorsus]|nr:hypothetical protein [Capnocytophaga canimorsus]WGU69162.1 hypothetical protein QIU19_04975 [Capnocytophaga canimorsus]WGU69730.1 hypothetical protein QIU18_08740 [Capnocytophaga canimorsus]